MKKPKSCADELGVTPEEAAKLAAGVVWHFMDDPEEVARFLLLCHALTYAPGMTDRETILIEIEKVCAPHLAGFAGMLHAEMGDALKQARRS